MKKLFLLPLLGLMFAGCANEPAVETGGEQTPAVSASSYLSISLVSAQPAGTRAVDNEYEMGDGTYVDGTDKENAVERVRFFFFIDEENNVGQPADVWKNSATGDYNSYLDWYPSDADNGGNEHDTTVEKILTATLGLSFRDGEEPTSVMAIINPTEEVLALGSASLAELQAVVNDFKTGLQGEKAGENFVMSNSVYVENEGKTDAAVVYTTALTEDNFCPTPEDAKDNPITIYVERVLARLDFAIAMEVSEVGDNIYKITKPNGDDYVVSDGTTEDEMDIYVKLLGWNITTTTNQSRLVKEIYPSWTSTLLFGQGSTLRWNTADYYRSFWALNPNPETTTDFGYLNGNFGEVDEEYDIEVSESAYPANGNPLPDEDNVWRTVYLQENASAYAAETTGTDFKLTGPADSTKVIIAAQLVDGDGEPLKLAMWGYKYYTLDQLKKVFANRLSLYFEDTVDGKPALTKITPDDIDFMTWKQLQGASETTGVTSTTTTEDADYYVYPVLSADGLEKTWYKGSKKEDDDANKLTVVKANTLMRDELNHAMVWNNGWTYYFFDVRHLGNEESIGYVGIVRNHLYATTVTSLKGLGTPVYDPDQTIYPEKTEYDESIVSASVKILSWRVVSNDYEIEWK